MASYGLAVWRKYGLAVWRYTGWLCGVRIGLAVWRCTGWLCGVMYGVGSVALYGLAVLRCIMMVSP